MANKNYSGAQYMRAQDKEDRLLDKIDRRTDKGQDRENIDPVWQKHSYTPDGERVWRF